MYDAHEMPNYEEGYPRNAIITKYGPPEASKTNNDNTNVMYEITDAQTKNYNRRAVLKRSVGKLLGVGGAGGGGTCVCVCGGGGGAYFLRKLI